MLHEGCMSNGRKTTIYDIAASVGVSTATVSRVINKDVRISRATTEKVFSKMRELNFVPRSYGGPQKSGKHVNSRPRRNFESIKTIYFLHEFRLSNNLPNVIYSALADSFSDRNYKVIACQHDDFDFNRTSPGDGVIYYGKVGYLEQLLQNNIPFVRILMQPEPGQCKYDHITYNNESIGVMAADYLHSRGHERTMMIGPLERPFVKTRFKFFRENIEKAGGTVSEVDTYLISSEYLGAAEKLIKDPLKRPTGYFVYNDEVALMLYTYLDAIGIKPGVDIEVISCDNSLLLDNLDIKPASFDLHLQQIASRSAEQLLWRMKNPKAQPNILIIEPELVKFDKV